MKLTERIRRTVVQKNRIYILPSARGVLFLTTIVVLVLVAATYNNNLIFILAFFLFAIFFVSMVQTHFNLKGVRLHFISADAAFAGEPMTLLLHLTQKSGRFKRALQVRSLSRNWKTLSCERLDLKARQAFHPVRLVVVAWARGAHEVPELSLETYYPLGLFRAWKVIRPEGQLIVYPNPAGARMLEPLNSQNEGEGEGGHRPSPDGDFGELKAYQPGESYHQIAWKHFARSGELYSKVHWGEANRHYHIPWSVSARTGESDLCQMSAWIQQALNENASFSMELPSAEISDGSGLTQAHLCWRALALIKVGA